MGKICSPSQCYLDAIGGCTGPLLHAMQELFHQAIQQGPSQGKNVLGWRVLETHPAWLFLCSHFGLLQPSSNPNESVKMPAFCTAFSSQHEGAVSERDLQKEILELEPGERLFLVSFRKVDEGAGYGLWGFQCLLLKHWENLVLFQGGRGKGLKNWDILELIDSGVASTASLSTDVPPKPRLVPIGQKPVWCDGLGYWTCWLASKI